MLTSKPVVRSLSYVLSPSDFASCYYPPSYRYNLKEEGGLPGSVWSRWCKHKSTPSDGYRTAETPEYSASFILPDFFDDESFVLEIEESDTDSSQNTFAECWWRLPGIIAVRRARYLCLMIKQNIFVFFRKIRPSSRK